MTSLEFTVCPERGEDSPAIRELAEETFGPGRFARTAHRVRESAPVAAELSLTAWRGDDLAGSIRFSAIRVGASSRALLLGPLMVAGQWAGKGCGRALIAEGLELARARGIALVLLVGDLPYFERFGFVRVPAGQITLPGPVDPARILAVELVSGALEDHEGRLRALAPLAEPGE